MEEKIKIQKGFIQIPLLAIIIASIIVASVGAGVVLHKQGKLASITANISQMFKEVEKTITAEKEEAKSEESQEEINQLGLESKFQETEAVERIIPKKTGEEIVGKEPQPEETLKEPREEKEVVEEIGIVIEEESKIEEEARNLFKRDEIGVSKINVTLEMGTEVKGIISENTVWAIKNSPYIVTDDVLIEKGVTLKIEPGVIVKFQEGKGRSNMGGFEILNKGNITARGTSNNKIIFTSLEPDPQLGDWGTIEIVSGGSINFDNVKIEYASYGVNAANASDVAITNSYFSNCGTAIFISGPAIVFNNVIEDNYSGIMYCIGCTYSARDDRTFSYQGIRKTEITYNTIQNNIGQGLINPYHAGIVIELHDCSHSSTLSFNNIYNNGSGIKIMDTGGFSTARFEALIIKKNNIDNNSDYAVWFRGEGEGEIDMSNNWWGTTELKTIDSLIYDYYDSFIPGKINYQPIATSEIPDAGSE